MSDPQIQMTVESPKNHEPTLYSESPVTASPRKKTSKRKSTHTITTNSEDKLSARSPPLIARKSSSHDDLFRDYKKSEQTSKSLKTPSGDFLPHRLSNIRVGSAITFLKEHVLHPEDENQHHHHHHQHSTRKSSRHRDSGHRSAPTSDDEDSARKLKPRKSRQSSSKKRSQKSDEESTHKRSHRTSSKVRDSTPSDDDEDHRSHRHRSHKSSHKHTHTEEDQYKMHFQPKHAKRDSSASSEDDSDSHHHHYKSSSSGSHRAKSHSKTHCDEGASPKPQQLSIEAPKSVSSISAPVRLNESANAVKYENQVPCESERVVTMGEGYSFEILKLLGRGDVGRVYLVRHIEKGLLYAMKVMNKAEMIKRKKVQRVLTEREILVTTNHPFVVTMYYSFQTEENLYFIMDYCAGAEFFLALKRFPGKRFPEDVVRFYAAEVLSGLEYLHMMGIVYRDLKPENIMLHESGHIMLSDFNLSKQVQVPVQAKIIRERGSLFHESHHSHTKVELKPDLVTNSFVGTTEYLAPEVISGNGHSSAVDWWTFGILIFEMMYGHTPFRGKSQNETFSLITKGELVLPEHPQVSKDGKDLIKKLLAPKATKRLGYSHGAADVKAHKWFHGINWALLRNTRAPLQPVLRNQMDTSNFRPIPDDPEFELSGSELDDDQIISDKSFSKFTRVNKDLSTNSSPLVNRSMYPKLNK